MESMFLIQENISLNKVENKSIALNCDTLETSDFENCNVLISVKHSVNFCKFKNCTIAIDTRYNAHLLFCTFTDCVFTYIHMDNAEIRHTQFERCSTAGDICFLADNLETHRCEFINNTEDFKKKIEEE